MFQGNEKSLIIVHNSDTKQCGEFLHGLIGEKNDAGIPINSVILDAKTFAAYPAEQKSAKQKILYIGSFPESETTSNNITKWELNKFGISYGWHGSRAVIKFDKNPLPESDFKDMVAFAKQVSKGYNPDVITQSVGKRGFNPLQSLRDMHQRFKDMPILWKIGFVAEPFQLLINVGMCVIADAYNKKDELDPTEIKEQQMRFAVLHFCLYHLADFMGIKENEEV